jgi:hypothetical protein
MPVPIRSWFYASVLGAAVLGSPSPRGGSPARRDLDDPRIQIPFRVGEELNFKIKLNVLTVGTGSTRVIGVERVRGTPTFHTAFDIRGKVLFKRVDNHYESWFDTTNMVSLRHVQQVADGEHENKEYEFYPDRKTYVRNGEEKPSVAKPLDEGSFLFYLRSLPLTPGKTYTIGRYYNAERNPIVITVVRRERLRVPAGEFDAILIHPVLKSHGLFAEDAHAEVWVADDGRRTLLKLRSGLPVGTLDMELTARE